MIRKTQQATLLSASTYTPSPLFSLVFAFSILFLLGCKSSPANLHAEARSSHLDYFGSIQVIRETKTSKPEIVIGKVFNDRNGNGVFDNGEQGIGNVAVSNGKDVVRTDSHGEYRISVRDDMSLFVVQPSGWRVPTDKNYIPQFAYQHKPKGSPKVLRFGGLAPTGPMPSEVNFPLKESASDKFSCAIFGDIQAYSNQEISYFRDSIVDDIVDRGEQLDCIVAVGDVVGDDLSLTPRLSNVISTLRAPQWWAHGNHDIDFDADFDEDSADSWRNLWGPAYYAFEQGNVLFIVLDNVVYPCGPTDARLEGREFCIEEEEKKYNGRITDVQMEFVRQLLDKTPKNKTIVFAHHIPFVSFIDQDTTAHQTDNVKDLYKLVEGREALSLSGHTHTIENLAPGDSFQGWKEVMDIHALPFRHIVAGSGVRLLVSRRFRHPWHADGTAKNGRPQRLVSIKLRCTRRLC